MQFRLAGNRKEIQGVGEVVFSRLEQVVGSQLLL